MGDAAGPSAHSPRARGPRAAGPGRGTHTGVSGDAIAQRFEALVFDWDGTAVPDRAADADEVRALVERCCATGVHVAVVSGTHLGNVDGQLRARPRGPGRLLLALNRGSELFEVGRRGPRLLARRQATAAEDAALSLAAELAVGRFAARGLETRVVSQRLNRRKIDLIPEPEWADPPKARIDELLQAVEARLRSVGYAGLPEVAAVAADAAIDAGIPDAKITSDAKHLEVGLTDKSDSARAVLRELWRTGVAPASVLLLGDEFGPLGGMPGSDALMLVPEAAGAVACSVGVEPEGVPSGVVHVGGGPETFVRIVRDQLVRRREVPRVPVTPGWTLVVEADREADAGMAALCTLAAGVVGTTGAPLLGAAGPASTVVVAGAYDGAGAQVELLAAPLWDRLGVAPAEDDRSTRVLDLRTGVLHERVHGTHAMRSVRFASLARPGVVALAADGAAADLPGAPLRAADDEQAVGGGEPVPWIASHGTRGAITAAAVQTVDEGRLTRVAAYVSSSDGPEPDRAAARLRAPVAVGFDALLAEHRCEWARRWERGDVVIEGDDDLQLAVRVACYHLIGSVRDRGEAAVGARGLTGRAYRGHVFWDADTFVLPYLAATHPRAARAMLRYRARRLEAACAAARAEGCRGARFPWESADSGEDVTPRAARDLAGRLVRIRTGEAEVHIVGQVAWAAAHYIDWTGDERFAQGDGRRLLVETARYWASRARFDDGGRAHVYGVIGPDEYHEPVDDNAFTNLIARWNLRRAAEIARQGSGGATDGPDPAEVRRWIEIADALVDGYDPVTGVYEQFAGFFRLEPLRIADVADRPVAADLLLGRDRVRGAQVVKQADVLMAHHLLPGEVAAGSLAANLDYYEPRTAHGSSLSPGIHAALLARAGRFDAALSALRTAARVDLDDVTGTAAGGVHLASMGSVWQALAFGFAGVRPQRHALAIDPRLPPAWTSLALALRFRGVPVRVMIESGGVHVEAARPVSLCVGDELVTCPAGGAFLDVEVRR